MYFSFHLNNLLSFCISLFNNSCKKSFQESMGPAKHQCTQSLANVTFCTGQCPYLLGCPSDLNNIGFFASNNLNFNPFFLHASSCAVFSSSSWIEYIRELKSSNKVSFLLKGLVLVQSPPLSHSPPSKCEGANVLR